MPETLKAGCGLDVGTSFVIAAREEEGPDKVHYSEVRDAFFRIKPSTPVAAKIVEKGIASKKHLKDEDGSFILVGQDAIEHAVTHHVSASRPMRRGILSPKEPDARRILKFILSQALGQPRAPGEKVLFSVPAQPINEDSEDFNTGYHEDCIRNDLGALGFSASPLNEAEAICYSELAVNDYTGLAVGAGAGMINCCLMSSGEAVAKWSYVSSGDWIDRMAAAATGEEDSVVQVEKEAGGFMVGEEVPGNRILSAVSAYYVRLIDYVAKATAAYLNSQKVPKFSSEVPVIVAGGTSRADGFVRVFQEHLLRAGVPFKIGEVRHASDPLRSVSRGLLIAASL